MQTGSLIIYSTCSHILDFAIFILSQHMLKACKYMCTGENMSHSQSKKKAGLQHLSFYTRTV